MSDPFDIFELVSLETALIHSVIDDYENATTGTARLEALNTAINHSFAILELLAELRHEYPERTAPLVEQWRDQLLRFRDWQIREAKR
jgi:hypothetical protein